MKKRNTKRSLINSVISLVLCLAMLMGTTFAWFTDSVSSGVNRIQAGNLDIEVTHQNGNDASYHEVDLNTSLFSDVALWEPGVVTYENIKIENVGNLAAKVKLLLRDVVKNSYNGHDLTEVIKVAVVDGGFSGSREDAKSLDGYVSFANFDKTFNLAGKTESATDAKTFGIVLYWQPMDNDNLYNLKDGAVAEDGKNYLDIQFGLDVVATQNTVESDSFDNQYDKDATYPTLGTILNTTTEESAAGLTLYSSTTTGSDGSLTGNAQITTSDSGKLEKTIKTTAATSDSTTYDISYNYVDGNNSTPVVAFDTVQTNTIQLSVGLKNVSVTHSHGTVSSSMILGTAEAVVDGTYYYNEDTGLLTIHSKIYSEFKIDYTSDYDAVCDGQGYKTLNAAINYVNDNETIFLLKDIRGDVYSVANNKKFTINLNGKTIDGQLRVESAGTNINLTNGTLMRGESGINESTLCISAGKVTVDNFTVKNTKRDGQSFAVGISNAELVANENVNILSEGNGFGFTDHAKATLSLGDANVIVHDNPITTNVSGASDMDIVINGGNYMCDYSGGDWQYCGIYWASHGRLTINDGTFTSKTSAAAALYVKNGKVVVNGGQFYGTSDGVKIDYTAANATEIDVTINNGMFEGSRAGIYVSTNKTSGTCQVIIRDGVFNGSTGGAIYTSLKSSFMPSITVTGGKFTGGISKKSDSVSPEKYISGGTFNTQPDTLYIAEGYEVVQSGNQWNILEASSSVSAVVTKSEAVGLSGGTSIRKAFTLNGQNFIFEVNDSESFAIDVSEMKMTVSETNSNDSEAWKVTFADCDRYYSVKITGLKDSGDAGWPNLYIQSAINVSYSGEELDWNGWGYSATISGFEGNYYLVGGLHLPTANL